MLKKLCLGLGKASRAIGAIVQGPQIAGRQLTLVQLLPQGLWVNTSNIKLHVSDQSMEGIERYVNKVDLTVILMPMGPWSMSSTKIFASSTAWMVKVASFDACVLIESVPPVGQQKHDTSFDDNS